MTTTTPNPTPPDIQTELLAMYLEGAPVVHIARALQMPVSDVLAMLHSEESRRCIRHFEEALATQTRLYALASRIPAMAVLREVCASEGSIAERRLAATELLREHRASKQKAPSRTTRPAPADEHPSMTSTAPTFDPEPAFRTEPEVEAPAAREPRSSANTNVLSPAPTPPSTPPAYVPPARLPPPPSPFDSICARQISEPLPDAVPVAA